MKTLLLAALAVTAFGCKKANETTTSTEAPTGTGLSIETTIDPDPPAPSGNHAHIHVRDAQNKPVTGATVRLEFDMPAMSGMQAMHGGVDATEDGPRGYTVAFDLGMAGSWTITVKASAPAGTATARYTLRTGSPGLTPLGPDAPPSR